MPKPRPSSLGFAGKLCQLMPGVIEMLALPREARGNPPCPNLHPHLPFSTRAAPRSPRPPNSYLAGKLETFTKF